MDGECNFVEDYNQWVIHPGGYNPDCDCGYFNKYFYDQTNVLYKEVSLIMVYSNLVILGDDSTILLETAPLPTTRDRLRILCSEVVCLAG